MRDAPATFPTTVKRCRLAIRDRKARCLIDNRTFRFSVTLSYRAHGTALSMERFKALVDLACEHPTTAEGMAAWLKWQVGVEMPDARRVTVKVAHGANRDGVRLKVEA